MSLVEPSYRNQIETVMEDKELGRRLGDLIVALVDIIADIDGITRDEVLATLFEGWWTEQIINHKQEST